MQPDDSVRISHMLEAAAEVSAFVAGRSEEDLRTDRLLLRGVCCSLQIIGEAAQRISPETKKEMPEVPWNVMAGMRNRLTHAYFDINYGIVWRTATEKIPELVGMLKARGF